VKVHQAIASALVDQGITELFGLIGDGNLFMVDSYVRDYDGTFVGSSHEAGAVLMALGYAQGSGRLGVATVTHGPALTNTITPLVEAVKARTPLLLLAGDTAVIDRDSFQNIPQREFVVTAGAGFEQLRAPSTIAQDLSTAIRRANVERRPIVFNMPVEFQWVDVDFQRGYRQPLENQTPAPDPGALDRALGVIASARRPVIVAGQGAISARESILQLAARVGAPVATTLRAKSLFRGDPCNLGVFGTLSTPAAVDVISESDCIVAFGASLNRFTTASGSYVAGKRLVHSDIDATRIGEWVPCDAAIVGDAAAVADSMVAILDEVGFEPSEFRSEKLARLLVERSSQPFEDLSTESTVDLRTAFMAVEAAMPENTLVAFDGGRYLMPVWLYLADHDVPLVYATALGSIGLGMGLAIGASYGAPGRPVLLVTGDGGFMLGGIGEFGTAVRNNIDLVVVVANDDSYGAEHVQFRARDMDPSLAVLHLPDLAPVAEALGGEGYTVRNRGDLTHIREVIAARTRPLLIDLKLDPDHVPKLY
jgi:thiamine pyrophosphate-dependent acetolactate synthase large subunit-like protein